MSGGGAQFQFGDNVTMHGGQGNVGIQHNHGPAGDQALAPELAAMFARLAAVVAELARDARVPEEDRQSLEETLPVLREPAGQERRSRRNTLHLLAGLTRELGEAAAPALGLVTQLLAMINS
ncbi:hypothetical protein [Streptomyces sp. CBMA123]|uniref:hypothetical protein n=1 Tax=Streptomyces sp. CBMA123 TaxID=1896313 RepID=UPI001661F760|nr:hypothetical protein [Streptomyces sp. CBMA123]MBD0693606.1 hypothetical protein [Streptomyces sp. CBMA123]